MLTCWRWWTWYIHLPCFQPACCHCKHVYQCLQQFLTTTLIALHLSFVTFHIIVLLILEPTIYWSIYTYLQWFLKCSHQKLVRNICTRDRISYNSTTMGIKLPKCYILQYNLKKRFRISEYGTNIYADIDMPGIFLIWSFEFEVIFWFDNVHNLHCLYIVAHRGFKQSCVCVVLVVSVYSLALFYEAQRSWENVVSLNCLARCIELTKKKKKPTRNSLIESVSLL